jgi:hypothetical protein
MNAPLVGLGIASTVGIATGVGLRTIETHWVGKHAGMGILGAGVVGGAVGGMIAGRGALTPAGMGAVLVWGAGLVCGVNLGRLLIADNRPGVDV